MATARTRATRRRRAHRPAPATPRYALSFKEACAQGGFGKDTGYKLIREGKLIARKLGKLTIILPDDLQRCLNSLPVLSLPDGR